MEQPEQVVHAVIGLQAQVLPSAYLSIRARSQLITASQLQQSTSSKQHWHGPGACAEHCTS
ncbi:MAG: hypothetical protein ACYC3H_10690 [Bellilinea sp.]